jgi:hypothetical protein
MGYGTNPIDDAFDRCFDEAIWWQDGNGDE